MLKGLFDVTFFGGLDIIGVGRAFWERMIGDKSFWKGSGVTLF